MSDRQDIPVLTDMIEEGIRIKMSDLGLEDQAQNQAAEIAASAETDELHLDNASNPDISHYFDQETEVRFEESLLEQPAHQADPAGIDIDRSAASAQELFNNNPALEQSIRRILDEHIELAWQEIRLAIQQDRDKS